MRDDFTSAKHALMFVVFFWLFVMVCALIHGGCMAPERASAAGEMRTRRDAGVPRDPTACRGAEDAGKIIWWIFYPDQGIDILSPEPLLTNQGLLGNRYVCKDHGPEHHNFWWEQTP